MSVLKDTKVLYFLGEAPAFGEAGALDYIDIKNNINKIISKRGGVIREGRERGRVKGGEGEGWILFRQRW